MAAATLRVSVARRWICVCSSAVWREDVAHSATVGMRTRPPSSAKRWRSGAAPTPRLRLRELCPGGDPPSGRASTGRTQSRIEADLELGRERDLVPELEQLVAEQPLREQLRAQLMLALYRSGRQADALATYQDARQALVDELGLEPGTRLRELEQAMLRQDDDLLSVAVRARPPRASSLSAPHRRPLSPRSFRSPSRSLGARPASSS